MYLTKYIDNSRFEFFTGKKIQGSPVLRNVCILPQGVITQRTAIFIGMN